MLRIKFSGFWKDFDEDDNFIINILKKRFSVEISNTPNYLFYSVFSDEYLKYDCIRIFYTGENFCPDFNLCDYGIGFENIDFNNRYFRLPVYMLENGKMNKKNWGNSLNSAIEKQYVSKKVLDDKTDFCSFVYSNYKACDDRKKIFEIINKYKKVNSGGKYLNNIGGSVKDKIQFEKKHKFSLAIENGLHTGYTTEKIIQSFAAHTIPIYWGDPEIKKDINERGFINYNDFASTEELIERIRELELDDEKYLKVLREPVFVDENYLDKKYDEFENFLVNICSKSKEDSYKRNRTFWGAQYEKKWRRIGVYENAYFILTKIYVFIREIVMQLVNIYKK